MNEMNFKNRGEQVFETLKREILDLKLEPGRMISENEICERFGVSRTPVRDARKVLEYSMSDLASADRAAVEEQIAAGVSAAEAEALYLTDEYFENWYQSLCTKLSAYEG